MWMPFWLSNDHVFPAGLHCPHLAWGMSHLGDGSQGQALASLVISLIMIFLMDFGHSGMSRLALSLVF